MNCLVIGLSSPFYIYVLFLGGLTMSKKLSHEEFVDRINSKNQNIEIIGKYTGILNPIKTRCKICGYEWESSANSLSQYHSCPMCSRRKYVLSKYKTHEKFVDELSNINNSIEVIGNYQGNKTRLLVKCKVCGNEWRTTPNSLLGGSGCPRCNSSKLEKKTEDFLVANKINFVKQKRFKDVRGNSKPLPYDFFLPDYNMLIETNGMQHYNPIPFWGGKEKYELRKRYDEIKREYAISHGYSFLEIPYTQMDNINQILSKSLLKG